MKVGSGVTARSVEMPGSNLRVPGEAEALPRLPDAGFRRYLACSGGNPLAAQRFESPDQVRLWRCGPRGAR